MNTQHKLKSEQKLVRCEINTKEGMFNRFNLQNACGSMEEGIHWYKKCNG